MNKDNTNMLQFVVILNFSICVVTRCEELLETVS